MICGSTLDGSLIEKSDIIAKVLNELGIDPKECVMVGDTVFDIEGAKANGVFSVAVTYGYGERSALESSNATAIVDSVDQLSEFLLGK